VDRFLLNSFFSSVPAPACKPLKVVNAVCKYSETPHVPMSTVTCKCNVNYKKVDGDEKRTCTTRDLHVVWSKAKGDLKCKGK
jgi:hypothetical protein